MYRSNLRQQEQLPHFDDEADDGFSGGSYGDQYGDGGGGSDGIQPEAPVYFGTCMDDGWTGPDRATEQLAQADCDAHNTTEHGGDSHAFPVPGDRT